MKSFQSVSCASASACIATGYLYNGSLQQNMVAEAHPPGVAPTATTKAPSNLENPQVTLNATVNPGGEDTTYRFEYGTTTAYGNSAPAPAKGIGSSTADIEVSQAIGDLEPGTTYHFRVVAENNQGTVYGTDETFTTP